MDSAGRSWSVWFGVTSDTLVGWEIEQIPPRSRPADDGLDCVTRAVPVIGGHRWYPGEWLFISTGRHLGDGAVFRGLALQPPVLEQFAVWCFLRLLGVRGP